MILAQDYKKTVQLIKSYLKERDLKVDNFYMFGSRARGNNHSGSDFDFMIVIDKDISSGEKLRLVSDIREYLLDNDEYLKMDLIIKPKENYIWESQNLGFLAYTVNREGVAV